MHLMVLFSLLIDCRLARRIFLPFKCDRSLKRLAFIIMEPTYKSPAELQSELGERLRALRLNRNLAQREVAAKAGVALRSVINLEGGRGSTVETLMRVLNAMDAAGVLETLAPKPQISPLALLHSPHPQRRVRRARLKRDLSA
jgi:transcriptional regulator with XRE-family HTH domain